MTKPLMAMKAACALLTLAVLPSAWGFKDPLDLPAMMAPKAAKALMLNVTSHESNVLVVGERGIVLKKDMAAADPATGVKDADGRVWTQAQVPTSVNLTSAVFASPSVAYVVGHDGIVLKSTDAGLTWSRVFDGHKANEQVVAAAKKKMEAFQAKYDAASPAEQDAMSEALEAATFAFEDAEAGARFGPSRPMLDVWFKDENTGWVVGSYGQIFETTDGGANWTLVADRLNNPDFRHYNGLYGDSTGLMLIAGEAGRVYKSTDFAQTWERMDTGYIGHFYGTAVTRNAAGEPTIFAYGFGGNVYRLGPNASAWWQLKSPTKESLVQGLNVGNKVMFVDQKGRLVATDESGTALTMVLKDEGKPVTGMAQVGDTFVYSAQGGPRVVNVPR